MKTFAGLLAMLTMIFGNQIAFAHEGAHGPAIKAAPNGGKLVQSSNLAFELLKDDLGVKIYVYTHESLESVDKKPVSPSEITVVTKKSTLTNSKKKNVDFKLMPEGDHFKLGYKDSASYYDLKLVVSYEGKEETPEKLRFEP